MNIQYELSNLSDQEISDLFQSLLVNPSSPEKTYLKKYLPCFFNSPLEMIAFAIAARFVSNIQEAMTP